MSFIPPGDEPLRDLGRMYNAEEMEQEAEEKAGRYAELYPDGEPRPPSRIAHSLRRLRALVSRRD
jgi:hypothetical protein